MSSVISLTLRMSDAGSCHMFSIASSAPLLEVLEPYSLQIGHSVHALFFRYSLQSWPRILKSEDPPLWIVLGPFGLRYFELMSVDPLLLTNIETVASQGLMVSSSFLTWLRSNWRWRMRTLSMCSWPNQVTLAMSREQDMKMTLRNTVRKGQRKCSLDCYM